MNTIQNELVVGREKLIEAGFDCNVLHSGFSSIFGTIEPEAYNVGKNHFKPNFRCVFVGACANGSWYVTSSIEGDMRFYRCRTTYSNYEILNIFGHGKTPVEAVENFLINFKSKTYNTRK